MITRALLNAALWALVFAGASARGDVFTHPWEQQLHQTDCDQIVTYNPTKKWIWVTIYDLGKTQHLDYGWVAPLNGRGWKSGNYSCAAYYYVRAQVKDNEGRNPVDGPDIFDTTVQVYASHHNLWLLTDYVQIREGGNVINLHERDRTFAWAFDAPSPDTYNNAPIVDAPILTVVNGGPQAMFVAATKTGFDLANAPRCIPAGGQAEFETSDNGRWVFDIFGPYPNCNARTNFNGMAPIPWTVDWGRHKVVLRPGLTVTAAPQPGINQYSFTNSTPFTVKYVVEGAAAGPAPCVAAGATSAVYQLPPTTPPGPRKVTSYSVGRCGDANDAGVKLATDNVPIMPLKINYTFRWGFFPD